MSRVSTRVESPAEAFDIHNRLIEWRKSHPTEDRLLHHGYFVAQALQGGLLANKIDMVTTLNIRESLEVSEFFGAVLHAIDDIILSRADTVFLSDEVRELVKVAEATMPDDVLFHTDVYTPCGFIVMETPIEMKVKSKVSAEDYENVVRLAEKHGSIIKGERRNDPPNENGEYICIENWEVRGFSWGDIEATKQDSLDLIAKKYGTDSDAYEFASTSYMPTDDIIAEGPVGINIRAYGVITSTEVDGVEIDAPAMRTNPFRLMDKYEFMYGSEGNDIQEEAFLEVLGRASQDEMSTAMNSSSLNRYREVRRFLTALFRLMNEYVDKTDETLPRQFGRRAVRAGRTGNTGGVVTLSLRRSIYGDAENGTGRKITLAHLVRGHWRRQWYPSQNMHRAKWINAHRRGGHVHDTPVERPRVITVTK